MPKIDQKIVDSVFYLYKDRESAEKGINAGGTGFVVAFPDTEDSPLALRHYYYGVTNKHVACTGGLSVIRLNTRDSTEVLDIDPSEWEAHPDGDDIAIIRLDLDFEKHQVSAIPIGMFVNEHDRDIGIGDDVFMIGLFVDQEGREKNNPMARFGNISMLANKKSLIEHNNFQQEGYIVDMHSRTGFSGSPVFVYRTLGANLTSSHFGERVDLDCGGIASQLRGIRSISDIGRITSVEVNLRAHTMFKFLGINWGQYKEKWQLGGLIPRIVEESKQQMSLTDQSYVSGYSGMTCVAPAWKISQMLDLPKFVEQRKQLARRD